MDWLLIAVLAWVVYMIYGIADAVKNAKQRRTYETEIGRKVSNKEWRAYKKQAKKNKAQVGKRVPVKTKILDHSSGALHGGGGGVGRAIIGGAVAGPVGAVVGASTRKQKFTQDQYTMFRVWYSDGNIEVEKVSHKAAKYKKYLEILED